MQEQHTLTEMLHQSYPISQILFQIITMKVRKFFL